MGIGLLSSGISIFLASGESFHIAVDPWLAESGRSHFGGDIVCDGTYPQSRPIIGFLLFAMNEADARLTLSFIPTLARSHMKILRCCGLLRVAEMLL